MRILTQKKARKSVLMMIVLGSVFLLLGCHAKVRYPGETPSSIVHTFQQDYLFWGIIGNRSFEIYDYCAQGRPYEIHAYSTLIQSMMSLLTLGIYVEKTFQITCSGQVSNRSSQFFTPPPQQRTQNPTRTTRSPTQPTIVRPSTSTNPSINPFENQ